MSFPTFPLVDVAIEVEREQPAREFVSESGRKVTTSYRTAPVRHFRLSFPLLRDAVLAPAPWGAYSEPAALRAAYAAMNGQAGTDTLADPEGGSAITVRWESPLVLEKIGAGCWKAEVELEEVL